VVHPITARTRSLAIIGCPIEHSLTPRIQNAAWREASTDIVNVGFRVEPHHLETAVRGARALGLLGLMVTIPHKEAVLDLCDEIDQSARLIGAANLLHFHSDGRIVGYSSDGWAALKSLEEEGVSIAGARISILGGGGAARSLALTFARAEVASITLLNRTVERAQRIAAEAVPFGVPVTALQLDDAALAEVLPETDLLVNSTSIGMHPNVEETPVPAALLHPDLAVYDIVYNPLETRLLSAARNAGAKTVDGLGMLIYTNVRAAQVCAAVDISAIVMRAEALRALGERHE
jgi:shikimate dehydrogenase